MEERGEGCPFKGSFKGKGASRTGRGLQRIDSLDEELGRLKARMQTISDKFRRRGPSDGITLELHPASPPTLRWRLSKRVYGQQRYIDLFSETGGEIVHALDHEAFRFLADFEEERLLVNAKMRCAFAASTAWKAYVESMRELESRSMSPRRSPVRRTR